jgi:hypothetical protein
MTVYNPFRFSNIEFSECLEEVFYPSLTSAQTETVVETKGIAYIGHESSLSDANVTGLLRNEPGSSNQYFPTKGKFHDWDIRFYITPNYTGSDSSVRKTARYLTFWGNSEQTAYPDGGYMVTTGTGYHAADHNGNYVYVRPETIGKYALYEDDHFDYLESGYSQSNAPSFFIPQTVAASSGDQACYSVDSEKTLSSEGQFSDEYFSTYEQQILKHGSAGTSYIPVMFGKIKINSSSFESGAAKAISLVDGILSSWTSSGTYVGGDSFIRSAIGAYSAGTPEVRELMALAMDSDCSFGSNDFSISWIDPDFFTSGILRSFDDAVSAAMDASHLSDYTNYDLDSEAEREGYVDLLSKTVYPDLLAKAQSLSGLKNKIGWYILCDELLQYLLFLFGNRSEYESEGGQAKEFGSLSNLRDDTESFVPCLSVDGYRLMAMLRSIKRMMVASWALMSRDGWIGQGDKRLMDGSDREIRDAF